MEKFAITKCKTGDTVYVVAIETQYAPYLQKLAAFGIFSGCTIEILQTFPAYVLKIGFTELALDTAIARKIYVRKL